jgi:hypothetical protein
LKVSLPDGPRTREREIAIRGISAPKEKGAAAKQRELEMENSSLESNSHFGLISLN